MSRKNSPFAKKPQFSPKTLAWLQRLDAAVQADEPFQEADGIVGPTIKALRERDFIMESDGIDGTVKYKITGRGQQLLRTGDYYLTSSRGTGKTTKCEACVHRQVLDQVRERCPDVDLLFQRMEELSNLKTTLNGSLTENIEAIRDLHGAIQEIDAILGRL